MNKWVLPVIQAEETGVSVKHGLESDSQHDNGLNS
jgi:hypothetical protein